MDRAHLAPWSLGLPDDDFPLALAALGVLAAVPPVGLHAAWNDGRWQLNALPAVLLQAAQRPSGILRWTLPPVSARTRVPRLRVKPAGADRARAVDAPPAPALAQAWRDFVGGLPGMDRWTPPGPRLAVSATARALPGALACMRWLLAPGVGAAGVFVDEAFRADGRIDWRWPFTMAALPGDPLLAPMAAQQSHLPSTSWPFRYREAGRDAARAELLVIGAGVDRALAQLLDSGLALRCGLLIVAGLGRETPAQALPLLRALAARVSAEGVAVVDPGESPEALVGRLQELAYGLSHNRPLDVALADAFRPGLLLMLGRDLLSVSGLQTTVRQAVQRLRTLPKGMGITLSDRALQRLRLPPERMRAAPPPAMARPVRGPRPHAGIPALPERADRGEPQAMAAPDDLAEALESAGDRYGFDQESGEASAMSELNRELAREEIAVARQTAVPRHIHQRSLRPTPDGPVEDQRGYVLGQPVLLQVFIGPLREGGIAAPGAFPQERLPDADTHALDVVFHEPRQLDQPLMGHLTLPRTGDSDNAEFTFTPRQQGDFEGRITVLHRGRVLQTVLLRTRVHASGQALAADATGIRLEDALAVREDWSDLARRRRFDLAIVHNHSADGQSMLTGVTGAQAWATRLDGIEQPVRRLNDLLSGVAHSVADHEDGLDQGENPALLVKLARVGASLYSVLYRDQLRQLASDGFDVGDERVTHVQVVSARPDAVVPLEFLYDYNAPDPDATLCPQHREALKTGRCPADCARHAQPRGHVCPMGFWGLKKVIERHLFDPRAMAQAPAGAEVLLRVEAVAGRDHLDLSAGVLLGHSTEVAPDDVQPLLNLLAKRFEQGVAVARDWDEWMAAVGSRHPALLLAFPHNEGKEEDVLLEIGGRKLYTLDLPTAYVRADPSATPVVLLLGCDVAGTAQDFSTHVRHFRQAGAAVVVSTIATVFGPHAVRVGQAIVEGLLARVGGAEQGAGAGSDAATDGPPAVLPAVPPAVPRIGEALRDARRAALLESLPMAMCVVAFGDADWRL